MRFDIFAHAGEQPVVLGHEWGEKLRRELLAEMRRLSDGDTVEISFEGVEIVSTMSVSAFLVSTLGAHRHDRPQIGIVVTDASEDQQDVILKCLDFSSSATAPLFVACRAERGLILLGRVDATTRRTWDVASQLGEFRAADLGAALGLSPQLANNRLARLTRVGALVRFPSTSASGVREYVYRLPLVSAPARHQRRRSRAG